MTNTVNVPREVIVLIANQIREQAECSEFNLVQSGSNPDAARIALGHFYRIANHLSDMLAAAPKAEPVGGPYNLDLSDVRSKLSEIVECSRALRQGGPAPEDLDELSNALDRATGLADDILADVVWADPSIPVSQPEAPKVEQEPVAWRFRWSGKNGPREWRWAFSRKDAVDAEMRGYEVRPVFTHPAPASDELLDALGMAEYVLTRVQIESRDAHLVKDAGVARAAIAKHKGPQS